MGQTKNDFGIKFLNSQGQAIPAGSRFDRSVSGREIVGVQIWNDSPDTLCVDIGGRRHIIDPDTNKLVGILDSAQLRSNRGGAASEAYVGDIRQFAPGLNLENDAELFFDPFGKAITARFSQMDSFGSIIDSSETSVMARIPYFPKLSIGGH